MTAATTTITHILADIRCYKCGKLLFKWERKGNAGISVKCPRCGQLDLIRLST
jgi:phage FluMu protein Com